MRAQGLWGCTGISRILQKGCPALLAGEWSPEAVVSRPAAPPGNATTEAVCGCVCVSFPAGCVLRTGAVLRPRLKPSAFPSASWLSHLCLAGFKLPDSNENEYLMRAVTRVIGCGPVRAAAACSGVPLHARFVSACRFVGTGIVPVAPAALQELARMLLEV